MKAKMLLLTVLVLGAATAKADEVNCYCYYKEKPSKACLKFMASIPAEVCGTLNTRYRLALVEAAVRELQKKKK